MGGASLFVFLAERGQDLCSADTTPAFLAGTSREDVAAGVNVGIDTMVAAGAVERRLCASVAFAHIPAFAACLACIGGVDRGDGDSLALFESCEFAFDGRPSCATDDAFHASAHP